MHLDRPVSSSLESISGMSSLASLADDWLAAFQTSQTCSQDGKNRLLAPKGASQGKLSALEEKLQMRDKLMQLSRDYWDSLASQ